MSRQRCKKPETKLVNFHCHTGLVELMDNAVVALDTDRSKFIRTAVREKMVRHGVKIPIEEAV